MLQLIGLLALLALLALDSVALWTFSYTKLTNLVCVKRRELLRVLNRR
jgi:hypothetical protein